MDNREEALYWIKQAKVQHEKAAELIRLSNDMLEIARRLMKEEAANAS